MEKRILIAFILSFAVLYGFRFLYPPPTPPAEPAPATSVPSTPSVPTVTPPVNPGTDVIGDIRDVAFRSDLYTATLSSVGGVLKSFRLHNFTDAAGKPIELINAGVANKVGWPLALA